MDKFISRLPTDIVLRIIPYTYKIQNKNLLMDITNYYATKKVLYTLYHDLWIIERQSPDPNDDKNWLINDILGYTNNDIATMWGYTDHFYNIFKRNKYLQSNEEIDKYVHNLRQKDVSIQINIFLGLFTIKEREDIILSFPIRNN